MNRDALIFEVSNISKTLFLASIPSMIGFLSFIPTNYTGLSELGIISFIGLVVGLITNLIFLAYIILIFNKKTNLKINNNSNRLYKNIINFLSKKICFWNYSYYFFFQFSLYR